MLGWVGRVELGDQLLQAGGQDDEVTRRSGPGVAEGMRQAGGNKHGRTRFGGYLPILEAEPKPTRHDMPGLVVGMVHVQGCDVEELREDREQSLQDYGRQSGPARRAKRRYLRGLSHYLRQTRGT